MSDYISPSNDDTEPSTLFQRERQGLAGEIEPTLTSRQSFRSDAESIHLRKLADCASLAHRIVICPIMTHSC